MMGSSFTLLTIFCPLVSQSEILNCDAKRNVVCGPCDSGDAACDLYCSGPSEVCAESRLLCAANSDCRIYCSTDSSCTDGVVLAGSVASFNLDCDSRYSCDTMTVNVGNGADATINCKGTEMSCKDMIINAQQASNLIVNCVGVQACSGLIINAGQGNTKINCNENSGNVCYGLALVCGTGQCIIDCQGPSDKCLSILIDATNAQKFECLGSAQECSYAPSPFTLPTPKPTLSPTNNPTFLPTLPTPNPTRHPTKATRTPSNSPSRVPSISPTNKPSSSPIIKIDTTFSAEVMETPTRKPSTIEAASSNVGRSSTTSVPMTTLYPTTNQEDASICCECLEPATESNRIKGCEVDPECQQIICAFDDYCCATLWDKTCTFYASEQCEKSTIETTQVLAAAEQTPPTDFNLVWKFALVVLAVMVLIITCCCALIYIHKMCKNWTSKSGVKQQQHIANNHSIQRAQTEIVMPTNTINEGKKLVRVQSMRGGNGHHRMRSTDNYSMRCEQNVTGIPNLGMIDLSSDDLKHEDLEDVSLRIMPNQQMQSSGRRGFMMNDDDPSLSNSDSTSEYYKKSKRSSTKKKRKSKKKKKRRSKKKKKRRRRKRNTNIDYESSTLSSDNDDAGTEIMMRVQRSFSTSMVKRHSI